MIHVVTFLFTCLYHVPGSLPPGTYESGEVGFLIRKFKISFLAAVTDTTIGGMESGYDTRVVFNLGNPS